jgi:hypothetical protein
VRACPLWLVAKVGTKHVTVAKEFAHQLDERMVRDPSLFAWAAEVLRELRKGSWLQSYVDSLFQLGRGEMDIYAAYCFGLIHGKVIHGEVMTAGIELGHCPHQDNEIEANNTLLRGVSRAGPFVAEFIGGAGRGLERDDGWLAWTEPIECAQVLFGSEEKRKKYPPRQVALEVGTTSPDSTVRHILQEGGLARWPYGSEMIYLYLT